MLSFKAIKKEVTSYQVASTVHKAKIDCESQDGRCQIKTE